MANTSCRHPTASVITKRVSVNCRYRSFTGKTRGLMGCEQEDANHLRRRLKALGSQAVGSLRFVCSDIWRPYLNAIAAKVGRRCLC